MSNPHDKLVRAVLGEPEHAATFFRRFLPTALVAALDFERGELQPGSFVDEDLQERQSDLLYRFPLRAGDGDVFVYVLLEHQRTVDALMPFRLLRYAVRVWDRWLADNAGATRLPAVLPMVLFNGPGGWTGPRSLLEIVDLEPTLLSALERQVPALRFLLTDLSEVPDEDLLRATVLALPLLLLKHIDAGDLERRLGTCTDLVADLAKARDGWRLFSIVLEYLLRASAVPAEELVQYARTTWGEEAAENVMTTGERLIEEGIRKGLAEGLLRGRQEGSRALFRRMALRKFGSLPEVAASRIADATDAELEMWTGRFLTATSLEELFATPA